MHDGINEKKLKARMTEMSISQRELAKRVGCGLNHINEVINNKTSPRLKLVADICQVLEINDPNMKCQIFLN